MKSSSSGGHKTVVGIQYARGVAALLVVFYHIAAQMKADPTYGRMPHEAFEFGYVGVPIFFVISGFIISIVSLDASLRPMMGLGEFVKKRAIRILPFMWLAIIAYNLMSYAGTFSIEWGALLRAMVLWPSGSVKPNVIWTLRHEALFYILFAICFLNRRRHIWPIALWFAAPFIISLFGIASGEPGGSPSFVTVFCSDVNIMFGAGLLLGIYTRSRENRISPSWVGGAAAVYIGAIIVVLASWILGWRSGIGAFVGVTALSTFLIYCSIRISPANGFFDRLAALFGDASYAIYLVHNMVIVPALILGRKAVGIYGIWPLFMAIALGAILTGIAAHILVEKPIVSAINRRVSRYNAARP